MEDLNTERQKKIFKELDGNSDFKKSESILSNSVGHFILRLVDKKSAYQKEILQKNFCKRSKDKDKHAQIIADAVKKADKSKRAEPFKYSTNDYGFCLPLLDEENVFGYIIVCQLKKAPPQSTIEFFGHSIKSIIKMLKKDIELNNLYATTKPRSIALSTVHTVHRLIMSSLYLNELLERIARLSMQIINTNRCSIKLVDSKKKTLLPKATIDLRSKKAKLKKVKIGRWAPGKSVKYSKSIRGDRYLATPLIDEDVIGVITLYDKCDNQPFNQYDEEIMRTLAEQSAIAIKNAQLYREQEKLTMGSIKALAQIIQSRCPGMYAPKSVFLKLIQLVGHEFQMREHELKSLQYATILHDAGELMIPESVLRKKGKLTEEEYKLIKEHPLKGAEIIKSLKSLKSVAPSIMHHHENYDGTGYPKGLKGNDIPLGARIMAVVSSFEAMITKRPYKVPLSIEQAIEEIKKNSGKQFDPKVVSAFLKIVKKRDIINLIKKEIRS
ncbi:MAG: HD domain-containing protein [Candidatus Omnitrophica bacterium]|nr:HD domain-containing protein [Candidatus Omnitrophota bacterium]